MYSNRPTNHQFRSNVSTFFLLILHLRTDISIMGFRCWADGNNSSDGISQFIKTHKFNPVCKALNFSSPQDQGASKSQASSHQFINQSPSSSTRIISATERVAPEDSGVKNRVFLSYQAASRSKSRISHIINLSDNELPDSNALFPSSSGHCTKRNRYESIRIG